MKCEEGNRIVELAEGIGEKTETEEKGARNRICMFKLKLWMYAYVIEKIVLTRRNADNYTGTEFKWKADRVFDEIRPWLCVNLCLEDMQNSAKFCFQEWIVTPYG